jgi:hypothetical protein
MSHRLAVAGLLALGLICAAIVILAVVRGAP